eukprot:gene34070-biopygen9798
MEYIPGALLWVPDALSRRPDYKDISAREGLVEAGFVHPITGEPQRPPSAANTVSKLKPAASKESRQGRVPLGAASVRDLNHHISEGQFFKALQAEYGRSGPLQTLMKEIQEAPHQRTRDFCVVGKVLWRVSAGRYQLVLGEDSPLREVVLQEAHTPVSAGHAGRDKTLERVLRRFWWKGAAEDDSSAEVIARIYFDHIWKLHGAPMKIVSDRDPRFQDATWKELMRLMGPKVASTTPYNPRSDGHAEHTNRVVEDMLRSFVGSNPEDWDLWCANAEFAINDTRSDVTGFTPFELVPGHSPMSQLDLFLQAATGQHSKRKGGEDLVWVDAKHLTENIMNRESSRKLGPRWHGPLLIIERFFSDQHRELPEIDRGAPVAYPHKLPPKWRIHDVFAQHCLKEYRTAEEAFALRQQMPTPAKADACVRRTLQILDCLKPKHWFMENPMGRPWDLIQKLLNWDLILGNKEMESPRPYTLCPLDCFVNSSSTCSIRKA